MARRRGRTGIRLRMRGEQIGMASGYWSGKGSMELGKSEQNCGAKEQKGLSNRIEFCTVLAMEDIRQ